jgi:hypothetical protein
MKILFFNSENFFLISFFAVSYSGLSNVYSNCLKMYIFSADSLKDFYYKGMSFLIYYSSPLISLVKSRMIYFVWFRVFIYRSRSFSKSVIGCTGTSNRFLCFSSSCSIFCLSITRSSSSFARFLLFISYTVDVRIYSSCKVLIRWSRSSILVLNDASAD